MKKKLTFIGCLTAALFLATPAMLPAADSPTTITGKGVCAKCELKEADSCQNAIQVTKDGKTVTYYLEHNDVSKAFHKTVCKGPVENVTATGTVKEEGGKMVMTPTKVAVAK